MLPEDNGWQQAKDKCARLRAALEEIAAMRKIPFSRITPGNVIAVAERALKE